MNRLEPALRSIMGDLGIAQLPAVAEKTGIPLSAIYKIIKGEIGVSPANLKKLATLSQDPRHQFELLAAYLYDEAERGSDLADKISIQLLNTPAGISFADLPESIQYDLRVIGDRIKDGDPDLAGAIRWLARAIDTDTAETPEERFSFAAEDQAPYGAAEKIAAEEAARRRKQPARPPQPPRDKR